MYDGDRGSPAPLGVLDCATATPSDDRLTAVDGAFLALAPMPGRRLPDHLRLFLARPDVRLFDSDPVDHVLWEATDGVVVAGWQYAHGGPLDATPWVISPAGFAMTTGNLRFVGDAWRDRQVRARRLLDEGVARTRQSTASAHGLYTSIVATPDGRARIGADPLGLKYVYHGATDDFFVISSNASLAAHALADRGSTPRLDLLGAASIPFAGGYRISDRTGYDGVRLLAQGATIEIQKGSVGRIGPSGDPWAPDEALLELSTDELVDLVVEEITDAMRATAAIPVDRRVVDLTGGKDSRLVLATAMLEHVQDDFTYRTIGHDDLPDVRTASELASKLGLPYAHEFPVRTEKMAYEDQVRSFIGVSLGMTSINDLKPVRPRILDEVEVSGAHGECLRLKDRFDTVPRVAGLIDTVPTKLSSSHLLLPDVEQRLREEARAAIEACADVGSGPFDLMQVFHLRHRARKRGGPLDDLQPAMRVLPLPSITAVRAAFAMDGTDRQREVLHHTVMERASDVLVSHPFVGPGWDDSLGTPTPVPASSAARSGGGPSGPSDLVARLSADAFEERRGVWEGAIGDTDNLAWEVLDRGATLAALERFTELRPLARRELMGAITAAMWLGGDYAPHLTP